MIRIQWNSPFGGSGWDLISDLLGTHVWTKLSNFFPSGQDFLSIPGATWVTKSKVDCCLCLMLCLLHTHKHTKTQSSEPQRRAMTGGFVKWMQKAQQTFQFLRLIGKSESLHVSPGDSVTERERDHISISKTKSSWLSNLQVYIKQTLHCRHLNMTALSVFSPPTTGNIVCNECTVHGVRFQNPLHRGAKNYADIWPYMLLVLKPWAKTHITE